MTTTYGYDVGNRLTSVSTTATVVGSQVIQTRGFTYDRAGLLTSETHPEKGASGNGSVTYTSYDSRGHALRKTDGPHDLDFIYDTAERLAQVQEHGTNGRMLKVFNYSPANGPNEWSLGKLQLATRYNYETVWEAPSSCGWTRHIPTAAGTGESPNGIRWSLPRSMARPNRSTHSLKDSHTTSSGW